MDHIIPCNHSRIAGLHVLSNLQYIKPRANKQKAFDWHGTDEDILEAIRAGLAVFPFDIDDETGEVDWEKYRGP